MAPPPCAISFIERYNLTSANYAANGKWIRCPLLKTKVIIERSNERNVF